MPRASLGILPDDLYIEPEPWPRIGRPSKHNVAAWTVTDDWPDPVPITDAEFDVFETWFGDSSMNCSNRTDDLRGQPR